MTTDTGLLYGTAPALATAYRLDDLGAYEAIAATLPPLRLSLAEAAVLFLDAATWSLGRVLGRDVDSIDLARAWADSHAEIVATLVDRHGLDDPDVPAAVDWLGAMFGDGPVWAPAHSPVLHLMLAVMFAAEMFAASPPDEWPRFLLGRAALDGEMRDE